MKIERKDADAFRMTLTGLEARIFINCMGETMKALTTREFPSRMGAELYEIDNVISALAAALKN